MRHSDWISERPTVILGDFNASAAFKGTNWKQLLDLSKPLGLVSAYHCFFKEGIAGEERLATHFHLGREDRAFHLDYCFIPEAWVAHLTSVQVGSYADWHTISDHAPVVVDLEL